MQGVVIKSTGSLYTVRFADGNCSPCRIRGNLRLQDFEATNPLTVGDRVEVEQDPANNQGWITALLPRKNYIIRKSVKLSRQVQILAANLDRAWVVATPVLPKTSLGFIDRFLATAEAYNIPGGIIWNKSDLYSDTIKDHVAKLRELYDGLGYSVLVVSAQSGEGLETLRTAFNGTVNLLSGHSGVGKSTLINRLIPDLNLKTASISSTHSKGTHTTTFAEMHSLPEGGYLIDTPGIREFGTINFDRYEVSHFFPEIFSASRNCRFANCLHLNENACAVKEAVEAGRIAISRFESYLSVLQNEDIFR
ncbi:MAG: ribosome small subunit-dependent GTPase A [Bacteroidia bacterium]|nr:ribosome small subunit-dependent GTPase A [Bacteroidia bacterium]